MSEYRPTEYIVDFGDSRSNKFVRLNMALIEQNRAKLGEKITRCRDCAYRRNRWNGKRPTFSDWFFCAYWGGHELTNLDGFCKWGEPKEGGESC